MATVSTPLECALEKVMQSSDLTADQKIRAIKDVFRECNELEIIKQLKTMNTYLAIMTGTNLGE